MSEQQQQQHHQQQHHQQQQLSPDRVLAALPDAYMHSSTPLCSCQLLAQSPGTLSSSSLLSFSDSSASCESDLGGPAAAAMADSLLARFADDQRRLRRMRREERQLRQLVAGLNSRLGGLPCPDAAAGAAVVNKELLAMQRMSAESVLRTVQRYIAAKEDEVAAVKRRLGTCSSKCDSDSDSNSCCLLEF